MSKHFISFHPSLMFCTYLVFDSPVIPVSTDTLEYHMYIFFTVEDFIRFSTAQVLLHLTAFFQGISTMVKHMPKYMQTAQHLPSYNVEEAWSILISHAASIYAEVGFIVQHR